MTNSAPIISVFGSSVPKPGSTDYEMSYNVGRLLGENGLAVQTGGYAGVMSAASQGCYEAGGQVIGITCSQIESFRPVPPNQWVKEEIKYATLQERLIHLVKQCDGCIVMPGGIGTLSEVALIWSLVQVGEIPPCPIVLVGQLWQQTMNAFITPTYIKPTHQQLITVALTAEEAVTYIIKQLKS